MVYQKDGYGIMPQDSTGNGNGLSTRSATVRVLDQLYDKVERIATCGCAVGQVHHAEIRSNMKRLDSMDNKIWWLITMCFITLIGVAFEIGITLMRHGRMLIP